MEWKGRRKSSNVEDQRGRSGGGLALGGGLGGLGIIVVIIYTLLGGNPTDIMNNSSTNQTNQATQNYEPTAEEEELADFVSVVLADTEDVWKDVFKENNLTYKNPTLVLFTNSVSTACGSATSAVGPFYCPGDQKLYIDLSFYQELKNQFKAPGDFAMAYVVAHEVGHHVQYLLGTSTKVSKEQRQVSKEQANALSVKLELQADYYAGVFAHHNKQYLDKSDFSEAIKAASAIGDDTLQKQAQGYAVPETFTHGTSAQRMKWLERGYEYGDLKHGNTFSASDL
ncbi:metalloprotease [Kurthia sp. 3B1D]|uniref:Metalloprotease n=2 Tax=Kurthia TaxID=1649 RepID=A0A433RR26_9BACL|nr:neutral zinc metallopeptidase [Kurthia sp. 3B1D]RUS53211.1 metalloprotease [Kurthia sp. 3B1D]HIX42420.1 zinc metallopeptidase [Candidatus Kurthia intestinigallinarum]